jgi:cobalt-zinc-cadmium efflux system protein
MTGHEGHAHHHHAGAHETRLLAAFGLTASFMLVELVGGLWAGSLALIADAGHMLTDAGALALAWAAARATRRPHDARRTYGYHRLEVLAAFVNGAVLVGVVAWILVEAASRLLAPAPVLGGPTLAIAVVGLLVNLAAFAVLHRGGSDNLNVRGAALHVMGDLLGSLAAIVAGAVILATGWTPIDPLLSILVALLVLRSAWFLLRRSGHILLEGAPDWLDEAELKAELRAAVPEVADVHHLHVWMLTPERPLMTLHARIAPEADPRRALAAISGFLGRRYGVDHATVQIEQEDCGAPAPHCG